MFYKCCALRDFTSVLSKCNRLLCHSKFQEKKVILSMTFREQLEKNIS